MTNAFALFGMIFFMVGTVFFIEDLIRDRVSRKTVVILVASIILMAISVFHYWGWEMFAPVR